MSDTHVPHSVEISYSELAFWYNRLIACAGAWIVCIVVLYSTSGLNLLSNEIPEARAELLIIIVGVAGILVTVVSAYLLYRTAVLLFPKKNRLMIGAIIIIGVFLKFFLILLVSASIRATYILKNNGYTVGLFGAKKK